MSSILVTGAAGFVGSALARDLLGKEHTVVSVTRDRTRTPPGTAVVYGDVTDQAFCRRVLADYGIDTIYHLAAQSIVSVCAEDPISALSVAVIGTASLLQAVREIGRPCRAVVMSSDKVYGVSPPPYTEETPLDARHAYEVSKACQSLVARMFASNFSLDVVEVRAVNVYGPGDPNESRIVPNTIRRCLRGEPPLLHAGADGMRRQYIYLSDIVDALQFIRAHGFSGEAYCVGAPDAPMSVLEVMQRICRAADISWQAPEIRSRDARFHEIEAQSVDGSKLRALGWQPYTPFQEGIRKTLQWYQGGEI